MRNPIPIAEPIFSEKEKIYLLKCLETGWISSQGEFVSQFEQKFSQFIGCKYGISTANGTMALQLALQALDLQPGDEVIVPTLTFGATANAVIQCGGVPVFVDSEPIYWNVDFKDIKRNITKKTKGIIVVHLYGHPVDMNPILEIAENYNLWVIEDAAEAHGAEYYKKKVGSIGDIGCFSFFANKIITTGEGGMCVTNSQKLADQMRMIRDHGMSFKKKYWHEVVGSNYRLTNLQAAIGLAQLERIDEFINRKKAIAKLYTKKLYALTQLGVRLPREAEWAKSVWWMYNILLPHKSKRQDIMRKLQKVGIETRPFFYPLHKMPAFSNYPVSNFLKNAPAISYRGITLPTALTLTNEEIEYISTKLKDAIQT